MPDAADTPLVVVSNRGPVSFKRDGRNGLVPAKASGGLVSSLAPAVKELGALWFATAVSDEDREAAQQGPVDAHGFRLRQLAIDPVAYRQYYDVVANGTLWFLHHNLFDLSRRPQIDHHWWNAWHMYEAVNRQFADTVAAEAPEGAVVLVHDYHLTLVGKRLKEQRPDLRAIHFHHTPFADPNVVRVLPPVVVQTLFEGLAGHDACGFHSERWAASFEAGCARTIGRAPKTFVTTAAPDTGQLREAAESQECIDMQAELEALRAGRKLIVRVDRIELSKNLLRGFLAYEDLLRRYPQWRERVTFAAFVYPSREGLPEYLAYRNEVENLVERINASWATPTWQPIVLHLRDDFPHSVAALLSYDVLLVNPIRDGLNLVAKEGAMLNDRDGAIVVSREAGCWEELSDGAIGINPYDIVETSDALVHALEMSDEERSARARRLRALVNGRTARDWIADQVRAAGVELPAR